MYGISPHSALRGLNIVGSKVEAVNRILNFKKVISGQ